MDDKLLNDFDRSVSIRSKGSANLYADLSKDELKKKLDWYFKTPYAKFKERRKKPFKLIIQVVKIVLVTVQAILFAMEEFNIVTFEGDNQESMRNLFLLDYQGGDVKNLYTKQSVYNHIFHAWKQYYTFKDTALGSYNLIESNGTVNQIKFCKTWHKNLGTMLIGREEGLTDPVPDDGGHTKSACSHLHPPDDPKYINETSLEEFVQTNNLPSRMGWFTSLQMNFSFFTKSTLLHGVKSPDCYTFDVLLDFDNEDLDGTIAVSLTTSVNVERCRKESLPTRIIEEKRKGLLGFTFFVIVICFLSMALCVRSFKKHYMVYKDAQTFFNEFRHEKLQFSDKLVFVSFWYVSIVLADVCAIFGCFFKIAIELLEYPEQNPTCSVFYGLAVLFSWIGILKYFGFLKDYNTLLLTLQISFPNILRFICCAFFIYMGFLLCGWIVLGPYHEKFASIILSSECLYSLLNGDDMFNTYILIYDTTNNPLIIYFSKIYLYVFISLFMFVVLSLFIGIVEDTFETIRELGHAPKTRVELFLEGKEYLNDENCSSEGESPHSKCQILT